MAAEAGVAGGRRSRIALRVVLGLILLDSLRRAATQSFTIDESLTYLNWLRGSWSGVFENWIANNHVLNTLLQKACMALLGRSEFVLRLPTLLGAAAWLTAIAFLTRPSRSSITVSLVAAVVVLNPFLRDWMVAARGYGLALGAFALAFLPARRILGRPEGPSRSDCWLLGLLAGLGTAANLGFAFGFGGLALALVLRLLLDRRRAGAGVLARRLLLALVAFLAIVLPLYSPVLDARGREHLRSASIWESRSAQEMRDELVQASLLDRRSRWGSGIEPSEGITKVLREGCGSILPALLAGAGLVALVLSARRTTCASAATNALALSGGALLFTTLLHFLAERWVAVDWPRTRTALHLVALGSLALVDLAQVAASARRGRVLEAPIVLLAVGMLGFFLANGLVLDDLRDWTFDREAREHFEMIRKDHEARPEGVPTRVLAIPFQSAAALEYYADVRGAEWLRVDRLQGPAGPDLAKLDGAYDWFFMLLPPELLAEIEAKKGIRILSRDSRSGLAIGRRQD